VPKQECISSTAKTNPNRFLIKKPMSVFQNIVDKVVFFKKNKPPADTGIASGEWLW